MTIPPLSPRISSRYARRSQLTHLSSRTEVPIRFGEVDAMGIVWHGNYANYLEVGRDAFGSEYDLNSLRVYEEHGYFTPLVHMDYTFKLPLEYGDIAVVETTMIDTAAAKLIFYYRIFRKRDLALMTEAETVQVFLDKNRNLQPVVPKFFARWKARHGLGH